jgi:hypothetical protein
METQNIGSVKGSHQNEIGKKLELKSNVLLIRSIINEYIRWEGLVTLVERWISGAVVVSSRPGVGL